MFIFGHVGISVGAVYAIDRRADLRWVPLFGLLPDLIDKPLALAVPDLTHGWSRSIGHSLVGLATFSILSLVIARRRAWIAIVPYALHFLLDQMWRDEDRVALLWPYFGIIFPQHSSRYDHWYSRFNEVWQFGGELLGFAILAALGVFAQLWQDAPRRRFLTTGSLTLAPVDDKR